jgi:predicted nucleic acid-binding protein
MKKLVDSSFLISAIRTCDQNHWACYSYLCNHEDSIWVVPTIAYFEYQAAQSRLKREGKGAYRELYIPNLEVYDISVKLIRQAVELDLPNRFEKLRDPDLIYACIAKIEGIPLVMCDGDFDQYANEFTVINPLRAPD